MTDDAVLQRLYRDIDTAGLQPLWIESGNYQPRHPSPATVPAHWPSDTAFELLRRAGRSISSEFADRRVLVCRNPALPPFSGTTQTLYACLQLLLPGERAAEHRHSQNAFRFILSGDSAHTLLDGEKVYMRRGDLVIAPYWTWHGHANDSDDEVIWLDGLDNGIVKMFDATFFQRPIVEGRPDATEVAAEPARTSDARQWRYEWDAMRARIEASQETGPIDPSHGYRVRYLDPKSGRDPLPTMSVFLGRLPGGFNGRWYRSSDSAVFVVARGAGRTELPDRTIEWRENDVFTVPTWASYRHVVGGTEAILFSFSDRNAQERLECWREQRDAV